METFLSRQTNTAIWVFIDYVQQPLFHPAVCTKQCELRNWLRLITAEKKRLATGTDHAPTPSYVHVVFFPLIPSFRSSVTAATWNEPDFVPYRNIKFCSASWISSSLCLLQDMWPFCDSEENHISEWRCFKGKDKACRYSELYTLI